MSWVAFAVAAVNLVASVMFVVMFLAEVPLNGPYIFGRTYDVLFAVSSVLAVFLIAHLDGKVKGSAGLRIVGLLASVVLLAAAVALVLLALGVVGVWVSVPLAVAAMFLHGVWMFWVNRRLGADGIFSRLLSTWGRLTGAGLMIGLVIGAVGIILPPLTIPQLLVLGLGIFVAGGVWAAWPVWYLMLGARLRKADAAPRARGRRKAPVG
ncbi:hypothetical protein [Glaciibacter sp. 2TAF33]|uniref:hypothetical protein n=1 Tax=Glaciibacter sp. 2TAF33 TaxID=3233015 RepID=UPI003F91E70B